MRGAVLPASGRHTAVRRGPPSGVLQPIVQTIAHRARAPPLAHDRTQLQIMKLPVLQRRSRARSSREGSRAAPARAGRRSDVPSIALSLCGALFSNCVQNVLVHPCARFFCVAPVLRTVAHSRSAQAAAGGLALPGSSASIGPTDKCCGGTPVGLWMCCPRTYP